MISRLGCLDSVYKVCLDDHALSGSKNLHMSFSNEFLCIFCLFWAYFEHSGLILRFYFLQWGYFWNFFCWVWDILYFNDARCGSAILLGMSYRAQSHTEIFIYNVCLTKIPLWAMIDLKYLWQNATIRVDTLRDMVGQRAKLVFRMSNDSKTTISNRDIVPSLKF